MRLLDSSGNRKSNIDFSLCIVVLYVFLGHILNNSEFATACATFSMLCYIVTNFLCFVVVLIAVNGLLSLTKFLS